MYRIGDVVVVNDRMQRGYRCRIVARAGRNFAPGFEPPQRVLSGVYRTHADRVVEKLHRPPEAGLRVDPQQAVGALLVRHPERDRLLDALRTAGFDVKIHYPVPTHLQAPYAGQDHGELPETDRAVREILSLPITPELRAEDRDRLIDVLLRIS